VTTIRTILADDERAGRARLKRLLADDSDLLIVAECDGGASTVEAVRAHLPQLLLLDIHMPDLDGFQVLEALGRDGQPPAVIFVTAYDEHAVRAFDACALDYLLKPVSPERLRIALNRARERIAYKAAPLEPPPGEPHRFTVRSGNRVHFIGPAEIDWIEAAGNYMILHAGPANHMIRETMSGMESKLPANLFLRLSRSAIVNLRKVQGLQSSVTGHPAAILQNGQHVPISRPLREVTERLAAL
jgi:two-component system LytT family response regulator